TRDRGNLLIALIPHIVRTTNLTALDLRGVAAGTDQTVRLNYAPRREEPPAATPAPAPAGPGPTPPLPALPAAPAAGIPRLSFSPATVQIPLSAPLTLTLQADGMTDLFYAPLRLKWDPKILRLNQATAGTLINQDPQKLNPPTLDIRNDSGEAAIDFSRIAGSGGVNGSGPLAQFTFMAIGRGATAI